MPSTIEYNPELQIVQCTYVGRVTDDEFRKATVRAFDLARANHTRLFLIDDSKWEGGASTLGLYELPALFDQIGFERGSKGALILPTSGAQEVKDAHFFDWFSTPQDCISLPGKRLCRRPPSLALRGSHDWTGLGLGICQANNGT